MANKFYEELNAATIERQVEDIYNKGLLAYFPGCTITYPWACDGLIDTKTENGKYCKLIIEYKLDELLASKVGRAKVLIQVLFYLKKFEDAGQLIPNVCMVADKNECFVIQTNEILQYLDEEGINWNTAPSTAHTVYPDLVMKIAQNDKINPFVFNVTENFSFKDVADKIKDLADNIVRYVRVTEHNIATIFDYFCRVVIKDTKKISAHDLVGIFMGVITDSENYYQHPTKKNILVTPIKNVDINGDSFVAFFSYFNRVHTPQEKNKFAEIADRLIEDTNRRNSGDFWTPTPWVDYAHKMISEQLGENWKDEYVVWDNCCGSKNLTRDYRFKELYCSTLFESELEIGKRYNPEATSFQFDFLNDEIEAGLFGESKVPAGLLEAFKQNKKIVFLLNPPYGKATGAGGNLSAGSSDTRVKEYMQNEGLEGSEFIKQFLWRITDIRRKWNLTNCYIACFTNPSWLIKQQSESFRNLFLNNFLYVDGIMFQASEFADVSGLWGITFNIWKSGEQENKNEFVHKLCRSTDNGDIEVFDTKTLYNFDGSTVKTTAQYISENLGKKQDGKVIVCDDIKTLSYSQYLAKIFCDYICTITNPGNDIQQNNLVCIRNLYPKSGGGILQCTKTNFEQCALVYAIRSLDNVNWINCKDMYNMNNEPAEEFQNDAIVLSIFGNYCCGVRLDDGARLKNEFFWMSKSEIENLANEYNLDAIYNDARTSSERFVYEKLQTISLSPEAQAVLDKANELVRKSFKYRELFSDEHPEYQLDKCWDAGWYQVKALLKEYMKDDLKEFQVLYKALADKMRPMVYELGFLKK